VPSPVRSRTSFVRDLSRLLPLQFRVLYNVFLLRVIDLELLSADADTTKLVEQFAGMFATFSIVISAPLMLAGFPRIPPPGSWTIEHFLIATTMVIVGLFSVLTWDSIFPDRRDVLVLAPLPVRSSTLFVAKASALFAAIGIVIFSLNVVSGIIYPLILFPQDSGMPGIMRCILAYWITLSAAGLFLFSCIVAIQGLAAQFLPRQLFLRLAALMQVVLFCVFVTTYFLEPSLESPGALIAPENQHLLACLPTYWFLGLFNQLNGSMHPAMVPLVRRAWLALSSALVGSGIIMLLSYFRVMRKTVEEPDILPSFRWGAWLPHFGGSLKTALVLFSSRALLRSRQHRVLLSFYFGIGLAIVLAYVRTPLKQRLSTSGNQSTQIDAAFLAASILMLFIAFAGLRTVSVIPIDLRANWIFRVTQVRTPRKYLNAVRLSWLLLGVAPVWLISAVSLLCIYHWQPVSEHLLVLALLGILLVEISLQAFRKIPFACSYLPGKGNLHLVFWVFLGFFFPLLHKATELEREMSTHLNSYAEMILILELLIAVVFCAMKLLISPNDDLIFEEEEPALLVSLKLT
jgi:hypothetical protein